MSKRALKIASRRPMLLALIVMATITIGLLLSGWLTPAPGRAGYNDPDPTANGENCDNPTTTTSCASAAQLVLSNVVINPVTSNGAPYDSIVCLGGTITAQLLWFSIPSSNSVQTCHTCNGATPANYCDAPIYSAGASPFNITNTWTRSGIGGTNGFGDSVSFRCTNATSGNVNFANISAMMTTNPPACGVSVGWTTNAINPRTFAFVEVSDLSAQNYTPVADYGTNKIYRVCVVPVNTPGTNITVIATPNPQMDPQWLPSGWVLAGCNVSNKLTGLVDITTPGTNVVTCVSGISKKAVTIIVQQGTLHVTSDKVFVNNNNDNGDLIPITLNLQCVDPMQTVSLSVNQQQSGIGGIRVWASADRASGIPMLDNSDVNALSANWLAGEMLTNLWVEGVSLSANPGDVVLTLQPGNTCPVTTNLTVCNIQLAVDNNRDGGITFGSADQTSASKPYRFWVNNDQDYVTTVISQPYGPPITIDNATSGQDETLPVWVPDYQNDQITTIRDLEDFTRLNILVQGITQEIADGTLQVGLKWKNTSGTSPAIRLFRNKSPNGDLEYLTDASVAQQFLSLQNPGNVSGSGTYLIPTGFWQWAGINTTHNTGYIIFEGCAVGKGQLVVTINKPDGTEIAETGSVWLELKNIKEMYHRVRVTPRDPGGIPAPYDSTSTFDETTAGTETPNDGFIFSAPNDEAGTAVVFVHGSNISYDLALEHAETMFKRLWWQGYNGRFVLFNWDTLVGPWNGGIPAHYNYNEYRAMKYGLALKNYVENNLPSGYAKNVVGHSMGNMVVASALYSRGTTSGMTCQNVILMQAAVPASCFDSGASTYSDLAALENPQTSPDDFAGQWGYRGLTAMNINATIYNIYNAKDYALDKWIWNQELCKPENLWTPIPRTELYYSWNTAGGSLRVIGSGDLIRTMTDPQESMSFIARSRTAALGTIETHGSVGSSFDVGEMSPTGLGNGRSDHSGEFVRPIQQLYPFYNYLYRHVN